MRTTDEKCLHFVLRHYQKNKLDTQKALKAFKEKYQITEQERKSFRLWWILQLLSLVEFSAFLFPFLPLFGTCGYYYTNYMPNSFSESIYGIQ